MAAKSKLTKENIAELVRRFRDGFTNLEAIEGIMSEETYYKHRRENPEFAARMDVAREYTTEVARAVISKAIKRGDRDSAKWWLERKKRAEFSTRSEVENSGEQKVTVEIKKFTKG
jgi:hypothetical protein